MMARSAVVFALLAALGALALLAGCGRGGEEPEPAAGFAVMPAEEAAAMVEADPGLVILDVRAPVGFAVGHIPGAVNMDFKAEGFADELAKLDKDASYLVYCGGGEASAATAEMMVQMGFVHVAIIDKGYTEWVRLHLPTTKD